MLPRPLKVTPGFNVTPFYGKWQNLGQAKIRTTNFQQFQQQYLLQVYSKNLKIMLEPFTGTL